MKTSRAVALIASALAAGLVLSGCMASEQTDRQASKLGSNLCIVNNSSSTMSIAWRGYPDARQIPGGGQLCNSGNESDVPDVLGTLEYEPAGQAGTKLKLYVAAYNIAIGRPHAEAYFVASPGKRQGACYQYDVGEMKTVDTGWLHGEMTRQKDSSDHKEFVLILTDRVGQPAGGRC